MLKIWVKPYTKYNQYIKKLLHIRYKIEDNVEQSKSEKIFEKFDFVFQYIQ